MVIPELSREFQIPDEVETKLEGNQLIIAGPRGTVTRTFTDKDIGLEIHPHRLVLRTEFPSTRKVALFGMYGANIQNMLTGVTRGFQSRLKIVSSHFPITTDVREGEILINNFLGERHPRRAKIYDGVSVSVEGEFVTVTGIDKDRVAQTAANIEQATVIRHRDRRIFQDGIYLVQKASPMEE